MHSYIIISRQIELQQMQLKGIAGISGAMC